MKVCNKKKLSETSAKLLLMNSLRSRMLKTKNHKKRKEKRYYYCEVCNSFHVTSKNFKKIKMKTKFKPGDVVMITSLPRQADMKRWFEGNEILKNADMSIGSIHEIIKSHITEKAIRIETDYLWLSSRYFKKIGTID